MDIIIKRPLYPTVISHTVEPKVKLSFNDWSRFINERNRNEDEELNRLHKKLEAK